MVFPSPCLPRGKHRPYRTELDVQLKYLTGIACLLCHGKGGFLFSEPRLAQVKFSLQRGMKARLFLIVKRLIPCLYVREVVQLVVP